MAENTAHPLTPERWDDLVTVFGGGDGKGDCGRCWCMWWRLPRTRIGEGLGKGNKALFRKRVEAGPPPGLTGRVSGRRRDRMTRDPAVCGGAVVAGPGPAVGPSNGGDWP